MCLNKTKLRIETCGRLKMRWACFMHNQWSEEDAASRRCQNNAMSLRSMKYFTWKSQKTGYEVIMS